MASIKTLRRDIAYLGVALARLLAGGISFIMQKLLAAIPLYYGVDSTLKSSGNKDMQIFDDGLFVLHKE